MMIFRMSQKSKEAKLIRPYTSQFICLLSGLIFLILILFPEYLNGEQQRQQYVGADRCGKCHAKQYDEWRTSGHAKILHRVDGPDIDRIPLPMGYVRSDVSYVIGGFRWKALFLDEKGYLITSKPEGPGKNQYNIAGSLWTYYLPGEKVRYDCGECHTTGFSSKGHQKGLAGVAGTWRFEGVQCEACHGPGGRHAGTGLKDDIEINTGACIKCHGIEPLSEIPLKGVFLQEYTEANQLLKSPMSALSCVVCHNPHQSAPSSIRQNCESCHREAADEYRGSFMELRGVKCIDCHMPLATVIADGNSDIFKGDFRSHLFVIDHRKGFPAAEKEGRRINPGYLSVDYACIPCHHILQNRDWAAR